MPPVLAAPISSFPSSQQETFYFEQTKPKTGGSYPSFHEATLTILELVYHFGLNPIGLELSLGYD